MVKTKPLDINLGVDKIEKDENPKSKAETNGFLRHFRDYCSNTSIHGIGYFGQKRTIFEYIWWGLMFCLSVYGCSHLIYEIYLKWLNSPVFVSFATKNYPIFETPFPAITICPVNRIAKKYFNLTNFMLLRDRYAGETNKNVTSTVGYKKYKHLEKYAEYMAVLCDTHKIAGDMHDFLNETDFYDFTQKCAVNLKHSSVVKMGNKWRPFRDMFKETYTHHGLCYTFNRLRLDEIYSDDVILNEKMNQDFPRSTWQSENGYHRNAGIFTYPYRSLSHGSQNGIYVYLLEEGRNEDSNCEVFFTGYAVTLHYPSRLARPKEEAFYVPPNDGVIVKVKASMISTSPKVRNYSPHKRDCYFPSERRLRYFRSYTRKNCEYECLTNATLELCDCAEYHMPKVKNTKVCGAAKATCVKEIEERMINNTLESNFKKFDKDDSFVNFEDKCDCLDMCTDISYSTSVEFLKIDDEKKSSFIKGVFGEKEAKNFQISMAIFYFTDDKIQTKERNELYGPVDFLSNFGGLLGLFTGFSVLSCMEIIYFFTLRIFGNLRLFGHWHAP